MILDIFFNQAVAHYRAGRLQDAASLCARILDSADNPQARHMLGLIRWQQGNDVEAIALLEPVAHLDPYVPLTLGLAHLRRGDFARGLPLYETRKAVGQEARAYPQPLWTGEQDITGKTLFTYVEQGLGDTIQFLRYARLVPTARVVVQVAEPLVALLKTSGLEMIGLGETPPPFDYHIPLASIPLATGMTAATIPAAPSYLAPDAAHVALWRNRIGTNGRRIAVAWQGRERILGEEGKSFPVTALAPIAGVPGVRLIAVQVGPGSEQQAPFALERAEIETFHDTAAIMANCDLVISACSVPAHLAGALGVPCWLALKHAADWRWFNGRDDTPWYPSLRLFRQQTPGDWNGVFAAMAAALTSHRR